MGRRAYTVIIGLGVAGLAMLAEASGLTYLRLVGYGYPPPGYRVAYFPLAYGYFHPRPRVSHHGRARVPPVSTEQQASPANAGLGQPPARDSAAVPLPEGTKEEARRDLLAVFDYPLDADTPVPRLELSELPPSYREIADPDQRRQVFLRILLPLVLMENEAIRRERRRMLSILERLDAGRPISEADRAWLEGLARRYRVSGNPVASSEERQTLRRRVDALPPALALAQAANESAWGQSRFVREGRNLFGIWTYDESQGIVPKRREPAKRHLVRRFDSLRDSVREYLHLLNSHPAYSELRRIRAGLRAEGRPLTGIHVAEGLERYSAKGERYIHLIQEIIDRHDLESLNSMRLASG